MGYQTAMPITLDTLKEAIHIKEEIAEFEARLERLLGGIAPAAPKSDGAPAGRKRRKMSAAARAKIAAAARLRWAKVKGKASPVAVAPAAKKRKGGITAAGRARLAAAMKARWAARKKGAPALNARKAK